MRALLLLLAAASLALAAAGARAAESPHAELFSSRLDGSDAQILGATDLRGAFRGPGRRVFFVRRGNAGPATFWVIDEDGSGERPLGASPGDEAWPTWSPDGRTVGIGRADLSPCAPTPYWGCAGSELVLIDAETGAERAVLRSRGRGIGSRSWSPDGSRLAYGGELDAAKSAGLPARTLETIRPDGSGRRVLVRLPRGVIPGIDQVVWSPRGDYIAYGRRGWVYLVRPQGGASTQLVRGIDAVWSPRGDRLLVRSPRPAGLAVVDVATRRTRVLERAGSLGHATWSPDGARVAFAVRTRGVPTIAVVRVSDGRRLHTWKPGGDVYSLFFSRDGTRLLYSRATS